MARRTDAPRRRSLCSALCSALWVGALAVALLSAPLARAGDANSCLEAEAAEDALSPVVIAGDESGIGGTGYGDESGIGGTGVSGDESGLGGTGYQGDESGLGGTGIYGTLTAFGSICVNGIRVEYTDDVQLSRNDRAAQVSDLAVGQVVWLRAHERAGRYWTDRISVYSAVVGQVQRIDPASRRIWLEDRVVYLPDLPDREVLAGGIAALSIGAHVDVSGLVDATGEIVASLVTVNPSGRRFAGPGLVELLREAEGLRTLSLEGYVGDGSRVDRLRVSGLELDVSPARASVTRIVPGMRVRAMARRAADGNWVLERPGSRSPSAARPRLTPDEAAAEDSVAGRVSDPAAGPPATLAESAAIEPVEPVEPTDPIEPIEPIDPIGRVETFERVEAISETADRIQTVDRIEPLDRVVVSDRLASADRVERLEKIDTVERVDRVERLERVEKIDRVERVERTDRVELSTRDIRLK